MCKAARVFAVTLGSDCNLIVDCEYVDASRLSTRILVENSYYSKPPTDSPSAQPEANLLPKAGDVVLTSAYAVGIVKYVCSQGSQSPSNVSSAADLYSNDPTYNRVGTYLSTNESQYFLFNSSGPFATSTFNATATINSTRATGKVYPSSDLDGPYYGSLDQSYSTATGTLGLASVRYITTTSTYGGLLPPYTTCAKLPIPGVVQAPFSVPFQANFTFFSAYTPPI
ncbi:hypothetical protein KFL_000700200 [Klebsormidium nitens]|uniref:Uncharacterized protein n=1 Tax=Klebsormidium nitens TaxID=105231 RepID=A0A1Y1HSI9_KLENI|nr:hypothetical protein KFL_000700200 [Klebsormidium nitens]|eukprot:GAQ81083.1 hypothetical protein KFL_000700200 [Klebsormidium nitens]